MAVSRQVGAMDLRNGRLFEAVLHRGEIGKNVLRKSRKEPLARGRGTRVDQLAKLDGVHTLAMARRGYSDDAA